MAASLCFLKTSKLLAAVTNIATQTMPKATPGGFYAVRVGKNPGIYMSWEDCQREVIGYPKAKFKKFKTREEAEDFILEGIFSQLPVPTPTLPLPQTIAQSIAQTMPYSQTGQWSVAAPTLVQNSPYFIQNHMPAAIPSSSGLIIRPPAVSPSKKMSQLRTFCTNLSDATGILEQHLLKGNEIVNALKTTPLGSVESKFSENLLGFTKLLQNAEGHIRSLRNLSQQSVVFAKMLDSNKRPHPPDETGGTANKQPHLDNSHANHAANGASTSGPRIAEVYTDGSCQNNGKTAPAGGIGVFWGPQHPNNLSERLIGRQTNNRAELQAARAAVKQAKKQGFDKIIINTDSQFIINCMTIWIHKWKKNGWTLANRKPVINRKDIQQLEDAMFGIDVEWRHVKGHSGVYGNEQADKLANDGAGKPYVNYDSDSDFEFDD